MLEIGSLKTSSARTAKQSSNERLSVAHKFTADKFIGYTRKFHKIVE